MTIRQDNKKLYWAWKSMKQRCLNPKCKAYKNYGARGITVCEEWVNFEPFYKWASQYFPIDGLDLDRIDNNKGYSPNNCRWVSRRDNVNNRRRTVYLTVNGEKKPVTDWALIIGTDRHIIGQWIRTNGYKYAQGRVSEILKHGYKQRDFGYSHTKRVYHVETGKIFNSVKEAAKHFGLASCTISNAIRENRSTGMGRFTYELID